MAVPVQSPKDEAHFAAALQAYLGEPPSAAALQRPNSAGLSIRKPSAASANRGRGEDSSPETPGIPLYDGGFENDVIHDAPVPEAEPVPAFASTTGGRSDDSRRSKGGGARAPASPHSGAQQKGAGLPPRAPQQQQHDGAVSSPSRSTGSSSSTASTHRKQSSRTRGYSDAGKTMTPAPADLDTILGDASPCRGTSGAENLSFSRSSKRSNSFNRPRSGSRSRDKPDPPSRIAGALELDPLGSTSRRRFGGRG